MIPLGMNIFEPTLSRRLPTYQRDWAQCHALLQTGGADKLHTYLLASLQQSGLTVQSQAQDAPGLLLTGYPQTETNHSLFLYTDYDPQELTYRDSAMISACLAACDTYFQSMKAFPITLRWFLGNRNTFSYHTFQRFASEHPTWFQANGCLWLDNNSLPGVAEGQAQLALGAKGLLCVKCDVQTGARARSSHYGSIVPNAAWRLLWALGSLKDAREDILLEGFYDAILPYEDETLTDLLEQVTDQPFPLAQSENGPLLPSLHGRQVYYAHYLTPTCTINMITSGEKEENVPAHHGLIPTRASAQIDFHLVPRQDPQDIFIQLQQHFQKQGFSDISAQLTYASAPTYTTRQDPFVQIIHQTTTQVYKQTPILFPIVDRHLPLAPWQQWTVPTVIAIPPAKPTKERVDLRSLIQQIVLIIDGIARMI
jgi:hypothetical protein